MMRTLLTINAALLLCVSVEAQLPRGFARPTGAGAAAGAQEPSQMPSGADSAKLGLAGLQKLAKDPSGSMAEIMEALKDPQAMKEAKAMMEDPGFKAEMEKMMGPMKRAMGALKNEHQINDLEARQGSENVRARGASGPRARAGVCPSAMHGQTSSPAAPLTRRTSRARMRAQAQLGMAGLARAMQDPKMIADAMRAMQDPETMAQVRKMMADPAFAQMVSQQMEGANELFGSLNGAQGEALGSRMRGLADYLKLQDEQQQLKDMLG